MYRFIKPGKMGADYCVISQDSLFYHYLLEYQALQGDR